MLLTLLGNIVDEGRRFAATADMQVSDMNSQAPVGTTLALLERQLKVLTAVQARVHFALKQELKLIKDLIRDYTDPDYTYDPEYGGKKSKQEDYDKVDIIPVSDPNAATLSQRVVQYQAVMQMAQQAPQIYDMPVLHRSMLEVLGIKNADKLVPLPDDQKPVDPVSENQAVLKGKPLKAFEYQDHQSHMAVHNSMINDPMIMAMIGQNPHMQAIMGALQAHIAEHVGFMYRNMVAQQLGMALPPEDEKLPPEMEKALSALMAQAANQVMQQGQAAAAQQQAKQQQQDPLVQMQQAQLQLQQQEVQIKAQKAQSDAQIAQAKLQLEQQKLVGDQQLNAYKVGIDSAKHKAQIDSQEKQASLNTLVDIAKHKQQAASSEKQTAAQVEMQKRQAALQHIQQFKRDEKPPKEPKA